MIRKRMFAIPTVLAVAGASLFAPLGGGRVPEAPAGRPGPAIDHSMYSAAAPGTTLPLLFIHHSCGGQLFAPEGADRGEHCVYESNPNGGGLRPALARDGYVIHEASYGSVVGDRTDLFDWLPKFRDGMDRVLATSLQDESLPSGERNRIVMFKSCFPNSDFIAEGAPPGNAHGPALTVWNARATMTALLPEFARHPDVLFVYVTAPPLAPGLPRTRAWRWLLDRALSRRDPAAELRRRGALARAFNDWVKAPDGWLRDYPHHNVAVFDYYDVLTGNGRGDLLHYVTDDVADGHPAAAGNQRAASEFVPFLNRAVRRAGLVH